MLSLFTFIFVIISSLVWPGIWQEEWSHLPYVMLTGAALIFFATLFIHLLILSPLANIQQNFFPAVMSYVQRDWAIYLRWLFLFVFVLVSCAGVVWMADWPLPWIFPAWLVYFALSLDVVHNSTLYLIRFLDPTQLIEQLVKQAKKGILSQKDLLFWNALDNLSEAGLRGVERSQLALGTQVLQSMPEIMQLFFTSSRSAGRKNQDQAIQKETGKDEVGYTLFYLLQRLELINDKALHGHLELLCRQMIVTMSKLIILCAKFDLSTVSFPTHLLTKFALRAQQRHYDEVSVLATSSLLEIAKAILVEVDITYAELQEPFQAIINGLATIARKTFQKDKSTNLTLLMEPLQQLKALFASPKLAEHRDTPKIMQMINNVLDEFHILADVLARLPPIVSPSESS